jgi:hypothetical protein
MEMNQVLRALARLAVTAAAIAAASALTAGKPTARGK